VDRSGKNFDPGACDVDCSSVLQIVRPNCEAILDAVPLREVTTTWKVALDAGSYALRLNSGYRTGDGRTGDTVAVMGIIVDAKAEPANVAARDVPVTCMTLD
jgi:hypothetical protein